MFTRGFHQIILFYIFISFIFLFYFILYFIFYYFIIILFNKLFFQLLDLSSFRENTRNEQLAKIF